MIGAGHLAHRIATLVEARGARLVHVAAGVPDLAERETPFESISRLLHDARLPAECAICVVDDEDERNLKVLIALLSLHPVARIVVSLFNEHVAPHLQAAHPQVQVLNPARIAAPAFVDALAVPLHHSLRYQPSKPAGRAVPHGDRLMRSLVAGFVTLIAAATSYFHVADNLSWIDATYFVVVTVATVGYGVVSLLHASLSSKLVGIGLILASTCFIWMIFSLTVDGIIKRRVQLALGRRRYNNRDHVIVCGLGRLGYFVAEGLVRAGERVLIVESDEGAAAIEHFRSLGADVYVGDARKPRVLEDVGVARAKALYSLVTNDYANLEIGLNARSFAPDLRLILRIYDEAMSSRVREHLDIHGSWRSSSSRHRRSSSRRRSRCPGCRSSPRHRGPSRRPTSSHLTRR